MPCSHGRGVFHGREDLFSGSGPMQPAVSPKAKLAKIIAKKERMALAKDRIKSAVSVPDNDDVALLDFFTLFPVREDVGDAMILFDVEDAEFADELFAPAHEQFAVFEDALVFADVQHDEIELSVHGGDGAVKVLRQGDFHRSAGVTGQFNAEFLNLAEQDCVFREEIIALVADFGEGGQLLRDLFLRAIGLLEQAPRLTEISCVN